MTRSNRRIPLLVALVAAALPARSPAQTRTFSLDSLEGLKPLKAVAAAVTYKGRKAIRVTEPPGKPVESDERLVIVEGTAFQGGVIEVDLAGQPAAGAIEAARGFVGVAFRVAGDASRFECIYLRPTNGRANDQARRNHSTQYVSVPDFPWFRLRKEFPEKYESYVDLAPGEWTRVKIEVRGVEARLYAHGAAQPCLLVNDLKLGVTKGAVALWIGVGTEAHFANLRVTP